MSYIEKLQEDKRLLIEFFNLANDLEDKIRMYENTAYRGDALRQVQEIRKKMSGLKLTINDMLSRKPIKKEAVNA